MQFKFLHASRMPMAKKQVFYILLIVLVLGSVPFPQFASANELRIARTASPPPPASNSETLGAASIHPKQNDLPQTLPFIRKSIDTIPSP